MTLEEIRSLPKVELHCHLDGSLSREYMERQIGRPIRPEEVRVSEDCRDLAEYLAKFRLPLASIQSERGLREAGYDFIKYSAADHIIYTEPRFAPLSSAGSGLSAGEIIGAVLEGLEQGKREFGVEYQVIVCAMRHQSFEENLDMFRAAASFLGRGVGGADLAGDEASWPMAGFRDLFEEVGRLGLPFTIHAGECGSVQNVADAIAAGASRIGHGIAMGTGAGTPDRSLRMEQQRLCRERRIGIELCPTSNLQTRAVRHPSEYPLREFLDAGLLATISTDNRTVSGTTLSRELFLAQRDYGATDRELLAMEKNAVEVSFAKEDVKKRLRRLLEEGRGGLGEKCFT